jgi:hypothetical protein
MAMTHQHPSAQKLLALLYQEFGVPKGGCRVCVTLEVGEPVKVEVGYYPTGESQEKSAMDAWPDGNSKV